MATTFLEPGGDATFVAPGGVNTLWSTGAGAPSIVTDFVHGGHIKSTRFLPASANFVFKTCLADAGSRISFYIYLVAKPNATATFAALAGAGSKIVALRLTTGGVLQLWRTVAGSPSAQIGTNGATLSTGVWYRISLAYTITSATVNRFELFKDAVSTISITNTTISGTGSTQLYLGNEGTDSLLDFRASDIYVDNSNALTDPGDIWVTAKRPIANGTTNGFTTQIGSSGSGVGTGHSPQVNERPLSTTNGWSMVGAGSAVTEEYNIESASAGDIDISAKTIVDWLGWVSMKALVGETISVILNGASVAQAITSTITLYLKIKGSATYPAGTGADIGAITDTSLTTVSLYECGVVVAYKTAATTSVKTWNGLAKASIKTINGLAIASVKTWNGLS